MQLSFLRSLLVAAVAFTSSVTAQQITLPDGGKITGILKTSTEGTSVQVFRGIPYAEPPIGERRWKVSTVKPLAGDLDATEYGTVCYGVGHSDVQSASNANSEDCLFLNVFTPAGVTSTSNLPVMVWVHGGGFTSGAGNWYDGTNLIGSSGNKVVYVSINYRLSVFGFLAGDAVKAEGNGANFGLRDAATAMQWVKQNIAHFGGNPNDITAFGESAGAKSVTALLISGDGNQQLFNRAMTESGSYTSAHDMPNATAQNAAVDQIAAKIGCSNSNATAQLSCLRAANSSTIWLAGGFLPGWQPVVDKVYLLDAPIRRVLDGKMSPVPTLFGTNTNEGYSFVPAVATQDDVLAYLKTKFPLLTDAEMTRLIELYPAANFLTPRHRAAEIYGDYNYVCTSELGSLMQAQNGHTTFRCRFNETSTQRFGYPLVLHGDELKYVFNNVSVLPQTTAAQTLVKDVERYWTNVVLTNTPNGAGSSGSSSGYVTWPQYDATAREQVVLQSSQIVLEQTGAYMPLHPERCQFWYEVEQRLAPELAAQTRRL